MPSKEMLERLSGRPVRAGTRATTAASVRQSVNAQDRELAAAQDDARANGDGQAKALNGRFSATPMGNGKMLDFDFSTVQDVTLPHGLDGPITDEEGGFIVCDIAAAAAVSVWRQPVESESQRNSHVRLLASAACLARAWVWRP